METFKNKIENKEEPKPFLNDWDKKYLEKGVLGLIKKMQHDFNNDFPDVILLPERGARPLYYLLNPVFKKFNTEQNTKIPQVVYFSVSKKAGVYLNINDDIKTSYDLMARLEEDQYDFPLDIQQGIVNSEKVEEVIIARKKMKERAEQLQKKISANALQVAIVDEVLSNGLTVQEIRKAFNNEDMHAYTLVALNDSYADLTESGYRFNEESDEKNPQSNGYSFSFEREEDAIGVEKLINNKYSSPIKKEDSVEIQKLARDKKQLRDEMKKLGEEIAEKYY